MFSNVIEFDVKGRQMRMPTRSAQRQNVGEVLEVGGLRTSANKRSLPTAESSASIKITIEMRDGDVEEILIPLDRNFRRFDMSSNDPARDTMRPDFFVSDLDSLQVLKLDTLQDHALQNTEKANLSVVFPLRFAGFALAVIFCIGAALMLVQSFLLLDSIGTYFFTFTASLAILGIELRMFLASWREEI